jgi:hypothetical protein
MLPAKASKETENLTSSEKASESECSSMKKELK